MISAINQLIMKSPRGRNRLDVSTRKSILVTGSLKYGGPTMSTWLYFWRAFPQLLLYK